MARHKVTVQTPPRELNRADAEFTVQRDSKKDGALIVTPVGRVRGGHDLRDLVRRIPKGRRAGEMHWSPPVGREGW